MKRYFAFALVILLISIILPINVFATTSSDSEEIIYFDDGSYITIEISSIDTRATSTKTGNKVYTYRNSDGTQQWKATLTGTFTYTGSSSTCTSSSCNVSISDSDWYTISKSASKSGNSATASLTMGLKYLGVTVDRVSISLKLTCDQNGNLS